MKATGYVRVSTEGQADTGLSLEMQKAKVQAYCDLHDLELSEIICDGGYSAKNLKRPGVQKLMALVDARQTDAVVVYKLDRLSRSTRDTLDLIERFNGSNVAFHSIEEKLDTKSAMGEFVLTILAALATKERRMISDRTRDAMAHGKAQGRHMGRLGFRCTETVSEMKALRAQGCSYDDIPRDLNARHVPTDRGGEWKGNTVRRILSRAA
jgi:DNA invertase Pin-like site-specific DNA recombinase